MVTVAFEMGELFGTLQLPITTSPPCTVGCELFTAQYAAEEMSTHKLLY